MPLLSATEVEECRAVFTKARQCNGSINKPSILAVFSALNTALNGQVGLDLNATIPQPQRGIMTIEEKAIATAIVALKIAGVNPRSILNLIKRVT